MISIGFFGTPQIAATVLSSLIESGEITVKFVVSQPDKPTGRHLDLMPTPVKSVAEKHQIPLFQPEKIKTNIELFDTLRAYDVDYFIVVAYGRIMPLELINMPKKMCINIHGSILPRYR
jgi:methionyl-tRNA formyltransferase